MTRDADDAADWAFIACCFVLGALMFGIAAAVMLGIVNLIEWMLGGG